LAADTGNDLEAILKTASRYTPTSSSVLCCIAIALAGSNLSLTAQSQTLHRTNLDSYALAPANRPDDKAAILEGYGFQPVHQPCQMTGPSGPEGTASAVSETCDESSSSSSLPAAPEPGAPDPAVANPQREGVPWAAVWHQPPFSRIGIGADISLLGIGIKGTTPLDDFFDLRLNADFFHLNTGRFEVDGFNINANIHMDSFATAVDFYPKNSMVRLSVGAELFNGNNISAATTIVGGTSFSLGSATYYSSNTDPVNGTAALKLHNLPVAPLASFGFGRFVPHSNRHWSFPSEIGIVYTGAPSISVSVAGTVCTNQAQTNCSSVNDTGNPVGQAFNTNLNAKLAAWQNDLNKVPFYPIFAFSAVYSFNIR
jgi:hypothetical protein